MVNVIITFLDNVGVYNYRHFFSEIFWTSLSFLNKFSTSAENYSFEVSNMKKILIKSTIASNISTKTEKSSSVYFFGKFLLYKC